MASSIPTNPAIRSFERQLAEESAPTERRLRALAALGRRLRDEDALAWYGYRLEDQGLTNERPE